MNCRVKEFVDTCKPYQASQPKMKTEPIKKTTYPDGQWQHLHTNYKGPIAGRWYVHVVIDQYSKFPVVNMHNTTGWELLKLTLD